MTYICPGGNGDRDFDTVAGVASGVTASAPGEWRSGCGWDAGFVELIHGSSPLMSSRRSITRPGGDMPARLDPASSGVDSTPRRLRDSVQ
jgi:hypothetical protein